MTWMKMAKEEILNGYEDFHVAAAIVNGLG
jgi:hypothetical protein